MPDIVRDTAQNTDRIKDITDKLEQGIKDLFDGEKFKEYLNTMSKFHNYSFNNTLLISLQKPDASLVAGFNSWKNQFGRHINKGEKGISILAPAPFKVKKELDKIDEDTGLPIYGKDGKPIVEEVEVTIPYFKVVSVFDVSQTNGKELPELGADELSGSVQNYGKLFEALKSVSPVPVHFEKIEDGGKGYYHHEDKRIAINEGMSELQNVKTAIHEIAHAKLHDRDLIKADLAEKKDRKTGEVEAESIAYTVCQHYGIDTSDYSFGYIAAWGSGKETPELKSSLETIRSTASEIINKIDDIMLDKVKEKTQEQSDKQGQAEKPKSSNIIGNTEYKDIAEKNYFKLETAVALAVAVKLEAEGVPFSGRTGKENTTLTVGTSDVDKFKAIEKEVKAEIKPQAVEKIPEPEKSETPQTPKKSPIIGNTKYADIEDKKFFNVKSDVADKVIAALEVLGVKFSGKLNDNNMTTFTVSSADVDKFREAEKLANNHKTPPIQQTGNTEKSDIIGTAKYADITDKKYFKIDTAIAEKVAAELESQGVKFSGRIGAEKTTLTIGNADVDKYKAAFNAVKSAEAELKVADKMPEVADTVYKFDVYQVNDEHRDLRFESMKRLDERGLTANSADYDLVYSAEISAKGRIKEEVLEDIYTVFNVEHPVDFKGRSISTSDVIVMANGDEQTAHYCDNFGFKEIDSFFAERTVEVDKSVHTVADLEAQVKNGESISLMDLAKAVKNEKAEKPVKSGKSPSISEQLKVGQTDEPKSPETTQQNFPEVYVNNLDFAREHGEVEAYKVSKTLNIECAAAIDEAIRANSTPGPMAGTQYVDTEKALKDVAEKYGGERVKAVTAAVVADQDWDGRLSGANKKWAKDFDHPCHNVHVQTHLSIFDGFVNKVRDIEKILDKKPSIGDQLQTKKPEAPAKSEGVKKNKGEAEL